MPKLKLLLGKSLFIVISSDHMFEANKGGGNKGNMGKLRQDKTAKKNRVDRSAKYIIRFLRSVFFKK